MAKVSFITATAPAILLVLAGCFASAPQCVARSVEVAWSDAGAYAALGLPHAGWQREQSEPITATRLNVSLPAAWGDAGFLELSRTWDAQDAADPRDPQEGVHFNRVAIFGYTPPGASQIPLAEAFDALSHAVSDENETRLQTLRHDFLDSRTDHAGPDGTPYDAYVGEVDLPAGRFEEKVAAQFEALGLDATQALPGPAPGTVRVTAGPWEYWFSLAARSASQDVDGTKVVLGADPAGFVQYAAIGAPTLPADAATVMANARDAATRLGVVLPPDGASITVDGASGCS